ncbi:MAG: hypothetical protein FWE03_06715 [Firmicutes bacterium]|nr:hypothetical protein [Bacillota bacterium]
MKKLKAFFRKFSSKFTIQMNKRPVFMTLGLLVFINAVFLLVVAGVALAIDMPRFDRDGALPAYFWAIFYAGQWLVTPNSLLNVADNQLLWLLGMATFVVGIVLFTGTIVGLTTNYLRQYLAKKGEAKGKLHLAGHYVILNYNQKVLSVLINLMFSSTNATVLILSNKSKNEIRDALNAELAMVKDKPRAKVNLIVRKGDPFSASDLDDICIEDAKGILIVDNDYGMENFEQKIAKREAWQIDDISQPDFDALKLVLEMAEFDIPKTIPIAIETQTHKTVLKINSITKTIPQLANKSINSFSYNKKLGQFIAAAVLNPEITCVIYELLSYIGSEFYPLDSELNVDEYLAKHTESVPVVKMKDKLYVVAEDIKELGQKKKRELVTQKRVSINPDRSYMPLELFIVGENSKSDYIRQTLMNVCEETQKITTHNYALNERQKFIDDLFKASLDYDKSKKTIMALVLSDDDALPEAHDSNVFLTLIELHSKFEGAPPFKIITEILDAKNQNSIEKFDVLNVIISNRIISFFATQMINEDKSSAFYEEIFCRHRRGDEYNFEIRAEKASEIFCDIELHTFDSYAEFIYAAYHGTKKEVMPLGFIQNNQNIFYNINLDEEREYKIKGDDLIIYVKYLGGNN